MEKSSNSKYISNKLNPAIEEYSKNIIFRGLITQI